MNQDILNQAAEQLNKLTAPAKQLNALVVDHIEKLAQFQLDAAKSYAGVGITQLRSALEISDAQTLQSYLQDQAKVAEAVSKKLAADAEALAKLNQQLTAEVQKLAQQSAATLNVAAKPARKSA